MISTTAAINTCATAYQWHHALELLKNMADRPDVSTYSSALSACDLAGRWLEAFELVEEMARKGVAGEAAIDGAALAVRPAWGEHRRRVDGPVEKRTTFERRSFKR